MAEGHPARAFTPGIIAALLLAGCQSRGGGTLQSTVSPPAKPSPAATPLPITLVGSGVESTLFDEKGNHIALIKAAKIVVGPAEKDPANAVGALASGVATLYQKNQAAATFAADHLHADRETRTIVGTGNVRVHSLSPDGASVQADRMTWLYDKNKIVGEGHVVVTRNPDLRAPGTRFEADTAIQKFRLYGSDAPITGSF